MRINRFGYYVFLTFLILAVFYMMHIHGVNMSCQKCFRTVGTCIFIFLNKIKIMVRVKEASFSILCARYVKIIRDTIIIILGKLLTIIK